MRIGSFGRGCPVRLGLSDGTKISGWLWHDLNLAEPLRGYLVALDKEGSELRFVPQGLVQSHSVSSKDRISFPGDGPIREKEELHLRLAQPMQDALNKIDYNEMKRISESNYRLNRVLNQVNWYSNAPPSVDDFLESALQAKHEYQHLVNELRMSGVADILIDEAAHLSRIIGQNTLPYLDQELVSGEFPHKSQRDEVISLINKLREEEQLIHEDCGESLLEVITVEHLVEVHQHAIDLAKQYQKMPQKEKDKGKGHAKGLPLWPKALTRTAAVGKVVTGASFAAANVSLGSIVGVVSSVPTLTLGSVAAVVGIAASCYTGMQAACDGLKQFADTAEGEESKEE